MYLSKEIAGIMNQTVLKLVLSYLMLAPGCFVAYLWQTLAHLSVTLERVPVMVEKTHALATLPPVSLNLPERPWFSSLSCLV